MTDNLIYLSKALNRLRPGCEYMLADSNYADIVWYNLDGEAPTIEEVEQEINIIKQEEAAAEAVALSKRQALLDKLGITEEEAKLLLS